MDRRVSARVGLVAVACMVVGLVACDSDRRQTEIEEFPGPVKSVRFDVEAGRIDVFGSPRVESAWLETWVGNGSGLGPVMARLVDEELVIEVPCQGGGGCEIAFDLTMPEATPIDIELGRGEVDLFRTASLVDVRVRKGRVVGRELKSREVRVEVGEGRVHLRFAERPDLVDVKVERGDIRVEVPRFRYVCDFDREAEHVELNELYCHRLVEQVLRLETGQGRIEVVPFDLPPRSR
jgi:hypothetical protein